MSEEKQVNCFGCGFVHTTGGAWDATTVKVWLFGEERPICESGRQRHIPKKACVHKAVKRLMDDRACPACGKEVDFHARLSEGGLELCSKCQEHLDYGRARAGTEERTERETQVKVLTSFVRTIANHRGFNERYDERAKYLQWPFAIVTEDKLARAFMKALREMWKSAGAVAFNKGHMAGSNLLANLKAGGVGSLEYAEVLKSTESKYREEAELFERHVVEAVEAATEMLCSESVVEGSDG